MSRSVVVEAVVEVDSVVGSTVTPEVDDLDSVAVDASAESIDLDSVECQAIEVEVERVEQPAPTTDATPAPTDNGEGAQGEPVQSQPQSPGMSLAQRVEAMERQVADESVELAELDAQRADLKKRLKVSVELLVELRAKIEAKTSGAATSTAAGSSSTTPAASTSQADQTTPEPPPEVKQVDPATITPLEQLGITPGRLENLKATEATPGRNCTTIADLERLIREARLQHVRGFGEKAIDAVTDSLMSWRSANPVPQPAAETGPAAAPDATPTTEAASQIKIPDDIAKSREDSIEYRAGAAAALSGRKVGANPHRQGSHAWGMWDRGWQENFQGDDSE